MFIKDSDLGLYEKLNFVVDFGIFCGLSGFNMVFFPYIFPTESNMHHFWTPRYLEPRGGTTNFGISF